MSALFMPMDWLQGMKHVKKLWRFARVAIQTAIATW
jgi:hypothetical protein